MRLFVSMMAMAALLSSCNTAIGLGRDLRIAGEEMEKASQRKKANRDANQYSAGPVY